MRLTIIGPVYPYRGGIAHYTAEFARALIAAGDEVDILSFRRQYPRWLYPGKSDRDPSRTQFNLKANYLLDPLYPWTWEQGVRSVASYKSQRVVMAWWTTFWGPAYSYLAWRLGHMGLDIVFLIHNTYPHEPHFYDLPLARLTLKQGDRYILQSERERNRLLAMLPNAAPVYLCQLPGHDPFESSHLNKADARRTLGLAPDIPVVLFFGLVRPYKGLRFLLEAAAWLHKEHIPLQVLVAGEFWENYDDYVRLVAELGLDGNVVMANHYIPDEEVGTYFAAADLFAAPYIDGTQSAALKLAQGYGLPSIVTSAIADGPELPSMKVVPPANAIAFAQAIKEFLKVDLSQLKIEQCSWQPLIDSVHAEV
jgi:glycosyltransferase involved in cell wall biosynthesis